MSTAPTSARTRNPKTRLNWLVSSLERRLASKRRELEARIRDSGYYCAALAGESGYNITINSDLTVSCNCQDYDGKGHIGDLRKNSFEEVFFGPIAARFRSELADGRMPIATCACCDELKPLPGGRTAPNPRLPYRGLLLENTVRCNVDCVGCARGIAADLRASKQMSLEEIRQMADLVSRLQLQQLFLLNLGEPFLSRNVCLEIPILRAKNPECKIIVSTNGIPLNSDAKREAALQLSHIFFSLHGTSDEMINKYMRLAKFEAAYASMKAMVDYRNASGRKEPVVEWKYLLFNWNDHPSHIQKAIALAKQAGVDAISFWPTGTPFYGISWRYRLGLLDHVGVKSWKGREVDLRVNNPT